MMKKLRAADLFCGAGGTTAGAEDSGAAKCVFALNHWQVAVDTHLANFPHARHVNSRLDQCSPSECGPIDLLFASPECTHHSRARGGRPTSDQQRSGAWQVLPWVEHHRPSFVVIENVVEFRDWGPVGNDGRPLMSKRGKFFNAWLMAIQAAGYCVDHRELNAADYGAATSRNRLFVIARKGNRQPVWPEPIRSRRSGNELPGMGLPRWRAASEVIDWTMPIGSIFARKRPLADNTLLRLEVGLRRFVGPFVTQWDNASNRDPSRSLGQPLPTMVTKANTGICLPFQVQMRNHMNAAGISSPLGAITAGGRHHAIAATSDVDDPLGSVTTKRGKGLAIPFLSSFYGNETSVAATSPVATITTRDRHSLCIASCLGPQHWPQPKSDAMRILQDTMRELKVADLLFRMLANHELAAAQGFKPDYIFRGTKADVTRQIGNSVSPPVASAICAAIAG